MSFEKDLCRSLVSFFGFIQLFIFVLLHVQYELNAFPVLEERVIGHTTDSAIEATHCLIIRCCDFHQTAQVRKLHVSGARAEGRLSAELQLRKKAAHRDTTRR